MKIKKGGGIELSEVVNKFYVKDVASKTFTGAPNPFFRLQNYVNSSFFSGSGLVLMGEMNNVNKNLASRRHDFLA